MRRVRQFAGAWRVALRIAGLGLRAQAEYRADFLMRIAIGVVWQVSIIVFVGVLLTRFGGLGGWPRDAVLLMVGLRMLGHGLYVLFLGRVYNTAVDVQEGRIDAYLLRPMPVHRQLQLGSVSVNAFGDLLVGVALFADAVAGLRIDWTAGRAAYLAAAVIGAMLVEAAVLTVFSAAALRYPGAYAWSSWSTEMFETFGNYPLSVMPGLLRVAFTWVLPLAFIAYFPVATLTHHQTALGVPAWLAAASPAVALVLYVASRLLWNESLRHYTGVNG
jgi:ABC-2 type transport system permease protein